MHRHDDPRWVQAKAFVAVMATMASIAGHQMTPLVYDRYCKQAYGHLQRTEQVQMIHQEQPGVDRSQDPKVCQVIDAKRAAEERNERTGGVSQELADFEKERVRTSNERDREQLRRAGAAGGRGPDPSPDLARLHDAEAQRRTTQQRRTPADRRLDRGDPKRSRGH